MKRAILLLGLIGVLLVGGCVTNEEIKQQCKDVCEDNGMYINSVISWCEESGYIRCSCVGKVGASNFSYYRIPCD